MTSLACPIPNDIFTITGNDYCIDESRYAIDTEEAPSMIRRWLKSFVHKTTTIPDSEGDEWFEKALTRLCHIAEMPDNWDAEGSPRPNLAIVTKTEQLLARLQGGYLGTIPDPFVCPVGGGGIQFEWSSPTKHLEIEILDTSTIAFLKEELTPQGESTESGEYSLSNVELTRQLLDWFATI